MTDLNESNLYGINVFLLKRPNLLFVSVFSVLFFLYNFHGTIGLKPQSMHTWRQADCLSFVQNYYERDIPFLEPQMLRMSKDGNFSMISEFPIIYYTVGKLWKLFGKHEFIHRGINLLIVYLGLFYLFRMLRDFLKSTFWALFIAVILFTSPILTFYSNNFLANAPAFGFVLIGWSHFYKYHDGHKLKHLIYCCLLFVLAGLLKITALLSFGIIGIVLLYRFLRGKGVRSIVSKFKELIVYTLSLLIVFTWYKYSIYYNESTSANAFLQGILPFWELNTTERTEILHSFNRWVLPQFFPRTLTYFIVVLSVLMLFMKNKFTSFFYYGNIVLLIGVGAYFLLFFQVFDVHDYYLVNLLVFPLFVSVAWISTSIVRGWFGSGVWVKRLALLPLFLSVWYGTAQYRIRYNNDVIVRASHDFISGVNRGTWFWIQGQQKDVFSALEDITPMLRSRGIISDDLIISPDDYTINRSLYLIEQRGVTGYGVSIDNVDDYLKLGVKYFLFYDATKGNQEVYKYYLGDLVLHHKNVVLYKVKS